MRISRQIFPRVVALIVTSNEKDNVMTASFLMPISFFPKYVAFSIAPQRYSFRNLLKCKQFTLNLLSKEMVEIAKVCGYYSGKEIDKFEKAKLTKEPSKKVKPPVLKECPISFECEVVEMKEFGDHWLVVGKVVEEHVRKESFEPLLHFSGDIFMEAKEIR